ncbi:chemotaxis protein CheW [Domibacillus sp. DTU_2020_1001157_1_SI_ALB_TIR_016]|uniref:chemotaxis protein CheW n=1 Tax=Domibacillus sp. DTU_2020_1001157_1_SI_ALB_TIR_016 TaxID=3077789 RepID=UPI0028E688FF|nr:chemotaxis protein CheW [Domibacillus sp. DTU_2020_1001157_1_SI_ALB_TIR_016]WNS79707.1 chemotaxis protein CheW [Domibacillus sp. DTU_2020_1001157_1_SI_ALB_TIR_016]
MSETLASKTVKVIAFQLVDKEYALPVHQVYSIEKLMHITRVPGTVPFVKGVINLRGVVTPIIDLRSRFGLSDKQYDESTRIIIASFDDIEVGLVVDGANDVLDIPVDAIEPQPEVVGSLGDEYITGVAKLEKRLLIMLSLQKIFN